MPLYAPHATELVDLYVRLSVDREGKDSLERQEADLREWAARERLTVRTVWRDAGRSGYKADVVRPDFQNAVAAVTSGEVRTLAVWKLDRLSRRGAGQVGTLLDNVDAAGGRLIFLRDGIDSTQSGQRMAIVLMSELARGESANTSLRVRAKKHVNRKNGDYLGGPRPFGYVVGNGSLPPTARRPAVPPVLPDAPADRKLRQHPGEAPLVREAVDRLLAGETMMEVCRDWNARGVPTRRGGAEWRSSAMSVMVRSPALSGLMPERRRDTSGPNKWATVTTPWRDPDTGEVVSIMAEGEAPIVSESERMRLLDILDGRLRRYGRGRQPVKQPKSLLGTLIHCAACKRSANTFGGSYRCRRWHYDGTNCERPLVVSIAAIEPAVKRAWATRLATLEPGDPTLDAIAQRWLQKFDPAPLRARDDLREQIADAEARLTAADDAHYVRGSLDAARHAKVTAGIQDRLAGLRRRLAEMPSAEADLAALLDPELSLPAINAADVREARELLRLVIRRIEVTAAPYPGARFDPLNRLRISWVGDSDE